MSARCGPACGEAQLRADLEAALAVIEDLVDDEECRLDHDGDCQTHYMFTDGPCPMATARALLDRCATTTEGKKR